MHYKFRYIARNNIPPDRVESADGDERKRLNMLFVLYIMKEISDLLFRKRNICRRFLITAISVSGISLASENILIRKQSGLRMLLHIIII